MDDVKALKFDKLLIELLEIQPPDTDEEYEFLGMFQKDYLKCYGDTFQISREIISKIVGRNSNGEDEYDEIISSYHINHFRTYELSSERDLSDIDIEALNALLQGKDCSCVVNKLIDKGMVDLSLDKNEKNLRRARVFTFFER